MPKGKKSVAKVNFDRSERDPAIEKNLKEFKHFLETKTSRGQDIQNLSDANTSSRTQQKRSKMRTNVPHNLHMLRTRASTFEAEAMLGNAIRSNGRLQIPRRSQALTESEIDAMMNDDNIVKATFIKKVNPCKVFYMHYLFGMRIEDTLICELVVEEEGVRKQKYVDPDDVLDGIGNIERMKRVFDKLVKATSDAEKQIYTRELNAFAYDTSIEF
jgi:hypothetical protein